MNISEPVKVETPKQITNLEAAKIALRADGSKYAHLSPRQAALLAEYIERLETELLARDDILIGVAHGDQYDIAPLSWHKANSGKRYEKLAVEK